MALGFEKCWSWNCYCHYGYSELRAQRNKQRYIHYQERNSIWNIQFLFFVTLVHLWSERESLGERGRTLASGPSSLQLGCQRLPKIMLLLGCYLDICQVGNASKDLRSPSLSRRTATEMAFHELNYVLGFKANTAQKMFPSQEVLSQRSEGVPGNDGAQLPSQGTSPTTSVTTEL